MILGRVHLIEASDFVRYAAHYGLKSDIATCQRRGHYRTFRDSYTTRRHHAASASRRIVLWFGQRGRQLLSNIKRAGKRLVRCHAATFREERTDEFTLIGGQCAFPAGVAC